MALKCVIVWEPPLSPEEAAERRRALGVAFYRFYLSTRDRLPELRRDEEAVVDAVPDDPTPKPTRRRKSPKAEG